MTIKQKQALLIFLDYYTGKLDGIWGPKSRKAEEGFRRDFGLPDSAPEDDIEKALRHAVAYGMPEREAEKNVEMEPAGDDWWQDIKYFTRNETGIACKCGKCGGFPVEPTQTLMRNADKVREHFGLPMKPISTVRCKAHNAAVGGKKASRHLYGKAMDFRIPGKSSNQILAYVRTLKPRYAYAIDGSSVHMDFEE